MKIKIDKYEFAFVKSENPQARILIADVELNPPEELLMGAGPAIQKRVKNLLSMF